MVIELAQFKTKPGVSDTDALAAFQEAHDGFLSKCKGFISHELLKSGEGEWVDIIHWETMEDPKNATQDFMSHPSTKRFIEVTDHSSIKMMHLDLVKKY